MGELSTSFIGENWYYFRLCVNSKYCITYKNRWLFPQAPSREDAVEEGMVTHSSILAWRIPTPLFRSQNPVKKAQLRTDFPFGCDRGGRFHVGPNSETGPALSPAQDSPLAMGSSIYPCPALAEYLLPYTQLACDCSRAGRLPRKLFCLLCSDWCRHMCRDSC